MTAVDLTLDDEILSPNEVAPAAKAEAGPAGASTRCHYCSEEFDGGFRFAKRGMHEKKEHRAEWEAARAPGAKKVARAKKATKKAAPAKTSAARGPKRISAAEPLAENIQRAAMMLGAVNGPMGRALVFSAPATGQAIDEVVAGTIVDRVAVQPFAKIADKWDRLEGILSFPILFAIVSAKPETLTVLEGELRSSIMDVIIASIPSLEKQQRREQEAVTALARLGKVDPRYAQTEDPVGLILRDLLYGIPEAEGDASDQ